MNMYLCVSGIDSFSEFSIAFWRYSNSVLFLFPQNMYFVGGGNRSTREHPHTFHKSITHTVILTSGRSLKKSKDNRKSNKDRQYIQWPN